MCTNDFPGTSTEAWTLFSALLLGLVYVVVFGFAVQDPAHACCLHNHSSGLSYLSLFLLRVLLPLALTLRPSLLLPWLHLKFGCVLVKVHTISLASCCQTLPLTIFLPCSVRLMSIICLWFLISDCLNYITWLLPPPRLQPGASLWGVQHPCPVTTVYTDRCRQTAACSTTAPSWAETS